MLWPNFFGKSQLTTRCGTHGISIMLFCCCLQLREEKVQEEKASEDLIHKLMLDDVEVGKRKMEEQQKKDDSLVLKVNQECVSKLVLSSPHQRHQLGEILLRFNLGAGVRFLKMFLPLTLHAFQG